MQKVSIHIEDKIMGSGKSGDMITELNKRLNSKSPLKQKYLVVVPLLAEVERYIKNTPDADFVQPTAKFDGRDSEFKSKKDNFMFHLLNGRNIVTTHSMFGMFDDDIATEIARQNYFIIIDEVLTCIEPFPMTAGTRQVLFDSSYMVVNPYTKRCRWAGPLDENYDGPKVFSEIRKVLLTKEVHLYRDKLFIFQTPKAFFECANNYHILTYRFEESSNMRLYFMLNKIPHNVYKYPDYEMKKMFKELITIVDSPKTIQSIKQNRTTFSGNFWKSKSSKEFATYRDSIGQCLNRRDKVNKDDMLYSCTKGISTVESATRKGCHLTPKGYSKSLLKDSCSVPLLDSDGDKQYTSNWIPFNKTATNDLSHKNYIVYAHNVFVNVNVNKWMKDNDIIVDEDEYALSTLIQTVWRTAIRKREPIRVMIFSDRMRDLFINWLSSNDRVEGILTKYLNDN